VTLVVLDGGRNKTITNSTNGYWLIGVIGEDSNFSQEKQVGDKKEREV
jgi:hypothetical protein